MICPNCGGEYADWAHKCPYCDSVNETVDEELYMEHLEEVRKRLDKVDDESSVAYMSDVSRPLKKIVKALIIVVIIVAFLLIISGILVKRSHIKRESDFSTQKAWELEEYPKLNQLYDQGKYDEIIDEIYGAKFDKNHTIYTWEHNEFVFNFYYEYREIKLMIEEIESGSIPSKNRLGSALYGALNLKYIDTDSYLKRLITSHETTGIYGISKEEEEIIKRDFLPIADTFFFDTLGMSQAEADQFFQDASAGQDIVSLKDCDKKAEELIAKMEQ